LMSEVSRKESFSKGGAQLMSEVCRKESSCSIGYMSA
jgi:hypothetical protein